jgi:amphi-Trp domain-containing protein
MASKESLDFNANVTAEEAAGYLESLAKSLRKGAALLESGDRSLSLEVGPSVKLELEAETDIAKAKTALVVKLSWRAAETAEAPASLAIVPGARPPAPVDEE